MRATSIQLYSRSGIGGYEDRYCGSFDVPCPDGDPRIPDLDEVGCGRYRDEDGTKRRAFFFADEIDEMVALAERQTGCIVEIDESWPYPRTAYLSEADESRQELNAHLERKSAAMREP